MKKNEVHKFKPPTNNLKHLLDDSVLDDETRRMLMKDIMTSKPQLPPNHYAMPTATTASAAQTNGPGAPAPHNGGGVGNIHASKAPSHPNSAGRARDVPAQISSASSPAGGAAEDLLVVMTQRLRALESQAQIHQKELKEKSMKIIELEDKYRAERIERKNLEQSCDQLSHQLEEMHKFLADYGLEWVGGSATSSPSVSPRGPPPQPFDLYGGTFVASKAIQSGDEGIPASLEQTAKPPPARIVQRDELPFDLEVLKRNADILTAHVGLSALLPQGDSERMKMVKERDMVFVAVYSDGICVNSGPFRPYGWPLCDAVLSDLLEGFYPYEFREKYPDGFPITIVDKSKEKCPTTGAPSARGGNITGVDATNGHGYKPLTREAFLRKLPERYVTANGHLVNIRENIGELISGGGTAASSKPGATITPATAATRTMETPKAGGNVTAVQIKLPQGQKVVLHMYFTDTVGSLRQELIKAVPSFLESLNKNAFEFASVFPKKTYDEHHLTLEEVGLVPNCTLMIKTTPKL